MVILSEDFKEKYYDISTDLVSSINELPQRIPFLENSTSIEDLLHSFSKILFPIESELYDYLKKHPIQPQHLYFEEEACKYKWDISVKLGFIEDNKIVDSKGFDVMHKLLRKAFDSYKFNFENDVFGYNLK